ncbi:MAG: hypothetical protein MJZ19_00205 [Paludibacteraceae bacterium]|nr:hypothetical protein [Paludibacteraceae bacterium]
MIDIRELRVGNYVYINNKVVKVEAEDLLELKSVNRYGRDTDFLRPVLLSQAILQKIGFCRVSETTSGDLYSKGEIYVKVTGTSVFLYIVDLGTTIGVPFSYLHQFQNVLFSLFHIELTLD